MCCAWSTHQKSWPRLVGYELMAKKPSWSNSFWVILTTWTKNSIFSGFHANWGRTEVLHLYFLYGKLGKLTAGNRVRRGEVERERQAATQDKTS